MVQYYYTKYTAVSSSTYSNNVVTSYATRYGHPVNYRSLYSILDFLGAPMGGTPYTSYSFSSTTGGYTGSGQLYGLGADAPQLFEVYEAGSGTGSFNLINGSDIVIVTYNKSTLNDYDMAYNATLRRASVTTSYNRGALVQSDIPAEDGTYPVNGRHTDGFWYIRGAIVPVDMTPGMVINQPYTLIGNGGRKLVRWSNGTLIAVTKNSTARLEFYKSTDEGQTWTPFYNIGTNAADFAMVVHGTTTYVLAATTTIVSMYAIPENLSPVVTRTIETQTTISGVSLAVDPTNGHLHAAWSSKNTTYGASFNLRYAKSTDGGATWSAVEQITKINNTSYTFGSPSIAVRQGEPIIACHTGGFYYSGNVVGGTSNYGVLVLGKNTALPADTSGTINAPWRFKNVRAASGEVIANPCIVVDKDGVIYMSWDADQYIQYSKSVDNMVTWSGTSNVSTASSYRPNTSSITVDKNNNVFVAWWHRKSGTYTDLIRRKLSAAGVWSQEKVLTSTAGNLRRPSLLFDPTFSVKFGEVAEWPPLVYEVDSTSVNFNGEITSNHSPTIALLTPTDNQTLYENDTINISGDAYDADKDQSVTIYYQINSEARKVLATNLSQTQISLSKQLTFKGGKMYDGETALTGTLTDGVAHTLKVWAEDSEKSSSAIAERTFYVVPNRAPLLTVDAIVPSGVVDADKFKISGTASDQDANSTVKVTRRINAGNAVEIYSGAGGAWEFDLVLSHLVVGQNTIVIEVIDNYGAKTSKTVTLNKKEVKTPILQSVARYKIEPPKGTAKGVLLFIQRDEELDIKVELSMHLNGEQEQYETLLPANTAPVQQGVVEDTFEYEGLEAKQNIILKITPSRTDLSFDHKIHLISGAVD